MLLLLRHGSMVTVGPKPHEEAALEPGPSPGRVGDGARQRPADVQPVHPSRGQAALRWGFSVSRRVSSRRSVSTARDCRATAPRRHLPAADLIGGPIRRPMRSRDRRTVPACRPVAHPDPPMRRGVGQGSVVVGGGACGWAARPDNVDREPACRRGRRVTRRSIGSYLPIGSLIRYGRSFDIRIITVMRSGWENHARRPRITRRWWAPPGTQDEENQPP